MEHIPHLIQDLSTILLTAAVTTLLFKKLKQPVILGYMVAGLLVGPHTHIFPTVTDVASIKVWAEMGVIFMLFSLGLEFSFRRLAQLGSTVLIAGAFELTAMCLMVFLLARYALGWEPLPSLFLGAMLSISSTSIIFKAFEEYRLKGKRFAQTVFGILIVEDLAAVLLMVILTTLSLSQQIHGTELLMTTGKLLFYLILWFVVGIFLIPLALKWVRGLLTEETVLVVSLALCLMMVVAAAQAGFSPAMGAFIMGAILGETDEREKIQKILYPVSTLFAAIFFVSVGMLINPQALLNNPWLILGLTAVLIVGKIYYVTTGALIAGQNVKIAIPAGISMAQIGEFSFIIATLGMTLKVTDEVIYSNIVAVSALTTFTTPYLIRNRDRLSEQIEKLMPHNLQNFLNQYLHFSNLVKGNPEWRELVKSYFLKILINIVMITAIFLLSSRFLLPLLQDRSDTMQIAQIATLVITLLVASPFLWGLVFSHTRNPDLVDLIEEQFSPRSQKIVGMMRLMIALILMSVLLTQYVSFQFVFIASIVLFFGLSYSLFRFIGPIYTAIESRFLTQLNQQERHQQTSQAPPLAPWDAHLSEYEIHPEAECVGKSLHKLHWRESFGVIIAMIQRGQKQITAPGRDEILMPYDKVSVIGTDDQLAEFENYLNTFYMPVNSDQPNPGNYILDNYQVSENSTFLHRTIKDSGIREKTSGLVVGVEREGRRILNPDSGFEIRLNDLLWIVGDAQKLRALQKARNT